MTHRLRDWLIVIATIAFFSLVALYRLGLLN